MREGKPSLTATWVAALRGLGTIAHPGFADDPFAVALIPEPYASIVAGAAWLSPVTRRLSARLEASSGGVSRHMAFRTRAIDEAVIDAVSTAPGAPAIDQLVLLGAGLDARAHRLAALATVDVFEVDHPSTQAFKRARAARLPIAARSLRYVSTDFEGDGLRRTLDDAGHDPSKRTVIVWEGVTMYLTRPAIDATLSLLSSRAAAGSRLATTYFDGDHVSRAVANEARLLGLIGEPIRTRLTREAIATLFSAHGFQAKSDDGDPEWIARFLGHGMSPRAQAVSFHERLLVTERL